MPLPRCACWRLQQRQVRAAALALVDPRVHLKLNSGSQAAFPAVTSHGFRRDRTCMVPSAPEARMPFDVSGHGAFSLNIFGRFSQEGRKWRVGPVRAP